MAAETVSVERICELLAGTGRDPLTRAAVSQFVAEGMPKAGRGKYNPVDCMAWYIARLKNATDKRKVEGEDGKEVSLDQADIRLKTVKAQLDEMTLAEREGTLIPLHLFEHELSEFTSAVRSAMMNLPARLADRMEGLTVVERKLFIKEEIRRALSSLAKKGAEDGEQLSFDDDDASGPSAGVSRKPARKPRKGKAKRVPAV